jgi:hypothetical protein
MLNDIAEIIGDILMGALVLFIISLPFIVVLVVLHFIIKFW